MEPVRTISMAVFTLLFLLGARPSLAQSLFIGSATGAAGTSVWIDVTIDPDGSGLANSQIDILFAQNARIGADSQGKPDCTVAEGVGKGISANFLPNGCSPSACTKARIILWSASDVEPMPGSMVAYRCRIDIASTAAAGTSYPLTSSNVFGADPLANQLTFPFVGNGQVTVGGGCS